MKRIFTLLMVFGIVLGSQMIITAPAGATTGHDWKYCYTHPFNLNCLLRGSPDPPNLPGLPSCTTAPTPQMPGSGLSGTIDPGVPSPDPNSTTVYGKYSYPPEWSTYDLGCAANLTPLSNPSAELDTTIGNWLKGFGTTIIAFCNSLGRMAGSPTLLSGLDPLLINGSNALHDSIYTAYIGLALLLVGIGIIFTARKRNMSKAVETAVWAMFVMIVATALWNYPVRAGTAVDTLESQTIGQVNDSLSGNGTTDPTTARGELLVNSTLYQQWCQGELGSSTSTTSQKYCAKLLDSQAYSYAEAAIISNDPTKATGITKAKQQEFVTTASKIQSEDPSAYAHLTGKKGGRLGAGAESALSAIFIAPFMIMASVLIVASRMIIRFFVIFFPLIAVVGIFYSMRGVVITSFERMMAAIVNAIVFSVFAAIDAWVIGFLLGGSVGIPGWAAIVLCGIVTVMFWQMLKPVRKLTSLVRPNHMARNAGNIDGPRRHHRRRKNRVNVVVGGNNGPDAPESPVLEPVSARPVQSVPAETPEFDQPPTEEPNNEVFEEPRHSPSSETIHSGPFDDSKIIRMDPVVDKNGNTVWQVWNPMTKSMEIVRREDD